MTRCQMAMENIYAAEGLTVTEAEFEQEYQSAVTDFEQQKSEYDDAKLREQVTENIKVCMHACLNASITSSDLTPSLLL